MSEPTGESSATGQINPECPMTNDLKKFLRFNDGMYVVPMPGSCKPDKARKCSVFFISALLFPPP